MAFKASNLKRSRKNDFTGNKILLKTNTIKYASQSWRLVVWFFQMYCIKMWKQDFLQSALAQNFYENCQVLFCLLIMHYDDKKFFLKNNVDQIIRYKVEQCWCRLAPNCPTILKKVFVGKFKCKIYAPIFPIMLPKVSEISLEWVMRYKVT